MAEWLLDNFTGASGPLSGHTPDVNTWAIPSGADGTNLDPGLTDSGAANAALSHMTLDGSGAVQMAISTLDGLGRDLLLIMVAGTPPSSPNYYVEIEVAVPSYASTDETENYYLDIFGRIVNSVVPAEFYANHIYCSFLVRPFSFLGEWIVSTNALNSRDDASIAFDGINDTIDVASTTLGTAAQTITLKAEFIENTVVMYVNGTQVAHGDWDGSWGLTAGNVGVALGCQNDSASLSKLRISKISAGDAAGAFWTEFVKTVEE